MIQEANTKLSNEEIERYARHIILPEIGGVGQQKLKAARVLVIGAGGLGAPVLTYLAAAGVGTLGIVDNDIISLSNLQRQVIHKTNTINQCKTDSAKATINAINPHVTVEKHTLRLDKSNVDKLLNAYHIIVDGSDNFATRYLLADHTAQCAKPLISGAVGRFDGSLTVLMPYKDNNPHYRDLFPNPPAPGTLSTCAETGIIGALPGVIGTLQAMEAIKLITNIGEPLVGKILLYNGLSAQFKVITYKRSDSNAN
ncbi:thiamine biosynthesis protein ThiF [Bartonella henselae]|uniref:Molybdopterin-synthase adenylyltransferase n=2 Tax=Bartonella TaxID=773 RepID=X5M5X8_BARHN|nr:molybdopterin-synthase adenylyltransferase MoeB [Bartonella henselae]MDM9996181.1 molybdopterin-synthase adenylyltransferase MoeB [Bartonella henselae]OLL48018.1 thiamine biosynthesis protein ThiF [Bartonella henselae]OLL48284.1 thiamine biosynthesis protein ThiF [Bartonella henselae]OLL51824.1 thiamine biosynthesis protein ThiF [Bartonella henselae]OLL57575.1 thiamine biosynthesis protein ThiF [Bartonella henselae]